MGIRSMTPQEKCALSGHDWRITAAAGWVVCDRCAICAICPACLGYRLAGYPLVFCSLHEGTRPVEAFSLRAAHPVEIASEMCSLPEQRSLW